MTEERLAEAQETIIRLAEQLKRSDAAGQQMADAAEMLWIVIANVSGGDWTQQPPDWQEAAARWRDSYFDAVKAMQQHSRLSANEWTPQEVLFAFIGWLTTRPERVMFSAADDAAPAVELIQQFAERHHLTRPRPGWENLIVPEATPT